MVTTAFFLLLVAVALQRMLEVRVSRLNEADLKLRGGLEHAAGQMPVMVAVHTAWLVCTFLEVWLLQRPFRGGLGLFAAIAFALGQALRLLAIHQLGERWTVKIITVPGAAPVTGGIFRYLRHPNYVGVIIEIAALPLIHGAWLTALIFSIANGVLLSRRIQAEEHALAEASDYAEQFSGLPRLVPKLRSPARRSRESARSTGKAPSDDAPNAKIV
jgi:methyltransferase